METGLGTPVSENYKTLSYFSEFGASKDEFNYVIFSPLFIVFIDRNSNQAKEMETLSLLAIMSSPGYLWNIKVTQIYNQTKPVPGTGILFCHLVLHLYSSL